MNLKEAFRYQNKIQRLMDDAHSILSRDRNITKVENTHLRHKVMAEVEDEYCDFPFTLDTRCKWDWWLSQCSFGGDLKTTFATSQKQFDEAVDFFDWDRSRAWYMDIARSNRDFIYGISKKNCKVFKKFIFRDDDIYNRGREKYEELAFQYWCLCPQGNI